MVVSTSDICKGAPRLDNTRLTVLDIVFGISLANMEEYIADHEIMREDAVDALVYCSNQVCKKSAFNYCNGCVLRFVKDLAEEENENIEEIKIDYMTILKIDDTRFFIGDKTDYAQSKFGIIAWALAEELLNSIG